MKSHRNTFVWACLVLVVGISTSLAAPAVTGVTGAVSHDGTITVSGSGFGTKAQAAPMMWDIVSAQYANGTNRNAYSALSDGSSIPSTIWDPQNVKYYTSRPHRSPYITAHYAGINPSDGHVALLTMSAPATQKRFYLSFYRKVKNGGFVNGSASPGGGTGSTKIVRVCGTDLSGSGANHLAAMSYGSTNSGESASSWIDEGGETTWVRWEVYVDVNKQWFDGWKNGHYHLGSWSGAGGTIEYRPAADWRFRPGMSGYQYDAPWLPANIGIVPALFGYDDGSQMSSGQEVDLSEVYYDNTQARVEISDQATWNDAPSATAHREVQGRLTSWSDTQVQLTLSQGGFDSLAGKYLYVIDADGHVNSNGYPLLASATLGDTNGDTKIDGIDLATLSQNWDPLGTAGPHTWEQGDFNGDGRIDGIDLAVLSQNWNPLGPPPVLPTVTIQATTASASESGPVNGVFTVSRTGATTSALAVNYTVSGTASPGDYTPNLSGTVTIPDGSASATVAITPVDDSAIEENETVILTLSTRADYTVGSPGSTTVAIADNDSSGGGTTVVLVDFGSSAAGNIYGLTGWNTPSIGFYSFYSPLGPAGVMAEWSGNSHDGGIRGTSRTFAVGEQIMVTWYNTGGVSRTFTPQVTFDDGNDPDIAPNGTWYNMTPLTLAGGATGTTTYTIDGISAGNHTLVNVCRILNNGAALLIDKIELQTLQSSQGSVMTLSAPVLAKPRTTSGKKNVPAAPTVNPSARRLQPWPCQRPANGKGMNPSNRNGGCVVPGRWHT